MKILILNWRDIKHPQAGGSELYFHEMAKIWITKGHEVDWICGGWENCKKQETIDKINIIRTGKTFSLYLFAPIAYLKLKKKPDVIIDIENGIPFFSPFFSTKQKILHIHHIHQDVWLKEFNFPLSQIGNFLESKLMPFIYKKIPTTTLSESSKKEILEKKYANNIPKMIPPGIEFYKTKKFKKAKEPTLLFLNRIKKYKGLEILLKAVKILQKESSQKFNLWVVGEGDDRKRMEDYAKKNNLKNIQFFGRVSEGKKIELMQKAWVFINPSFKEGWGIVNIESNYFGTPVLGSNVGGIKDSVNSGKTGLLFEYGNSDELAKKIKKLINDKKLLKNMEKESIKWAKKFSWENAANKFLKVIERK